MGADEKLDAVRGGVSLKTASRISGGSVTGLRALGGALGKLTSGEFKVLIAVELVACAVRLLRLGKPNRVVFDEVHFRKFVPGTSEYVPFPSTPPCNVSTHPFRHGTMSMSIHRWLNYSRSLLMWGGLMGASISKTSSLYTAPSYLCSSA